MVSGISDISTLQIVRATQAFKAAEKKPENINNTPKIEDPDVNVTLSLDVQNITNNLKTNSNQENNKPAFLNNKYIDEIQEIVSKYGNNNVTNEDINYALRYGRSILVDVSG